MQHSGRISGATKLIGLIGSPVQNSGSPAIHNAVFEHLDLDIAYIAFDVDNTRLEATVRGMAAMGFLGYNVTTPCKTFILPFLDEISEVAEIMGAVNTVVIQDGKSLGDNADGAAFIRNLVLNGIDIRGKKITVMGAGGAGSALITQAALDGVAEIDLFNRQDEFYAGAEELIERLKSHSSCNVTLYDLADETQLRNSIAGSTLLVNATNVGTPEVPGCLVTQDMLHEGLIMADTVYVPRDTQFVELGRANGNKVIDGSGMFLQQAAIGERLWIGREMPLDFVKSTFFPDAPNPLVELLKS
ncbi:shikimate dehydrogenase [Anaerotardibacter muris]|uniref:shikimate dehydrogenase n=1 Tax=Anaerotardibacter muris TaxID=2941505 RepID=UPI00203F4881|nr:shikimate dehydrogenase [Anaerotardibacter muris]